MSSQLDPRLDYVPRHNLPRFHDSSIAVVGNAASITDHEDGAVIDSHDHVIRFNSQCPREYSTRYNWDHTGSRTTVMLGALQGFRYAKKDGFLEELRDGCLCVARQPTELVWFHFPDSFNRDLQRKYGAEPTTGAICLHWLLEWHQPARINCFGFDFLKTRPPYRDGRIHTSRHCPEAERRMAIDFQRAGVNYPRNNLNV